ncbi:MAG TPA: 2-phosphosulfolactate phosphatase [Acidimicrobiales bacterium]|nr:2-phosphosulfolactate phosphatase [Acidimicrobiales bacterium]
MVEEALYEHLGQRGAGVRFDWGPAGAAALHEGQGCLVVVDVLSFTTAVSVAVGRGMAVLPYDLGRPGAEQYALEQGAELAVRRRDISADQPWSLSPSSLRTAPFTARLLLPSPNGSAVAAAAQGVVVAACLRNAAACARWALASGYGLPDKPVSVVAAGERWPDGTLRPAVEDALGAGAVLLRLQEAGCRLSTEAALTAEMYRNTNDIAGALATCGTGFELYAMGFGADVDIASELDRDDYAPVLAGGTFTAN